MPFPLTLTFAPIPDRAGNRACKNNRCRQTTVRRMMAPGGIRPQVCSALKLEIPHIDQRSTACATSLLFRLSYCARARTRRKARARCACSFLYTLNSFVHMRVLVRTRSLSNIGACMAVVDIVQSTLGPRGMDKLIYDDNGKTTISNDGATIMNM